MPRINLTDLNSEEGYKAMTHASDSWAEWQEKEIILEEGKKAVLGNLMNQEQALSTEKLSDAKAENRARNKDEYKMIVKQYASAVREKLKNKMRYFNLERYSSMRQTEINIQTKLANKQGG